MADVFISYSRKDKDFVRKLHENLSKQERDVWVDWEDIPLTADWRNEIYAGIEAADNFAFVITPDSITSKVCIEELGHALKNHKRLVPVMRRDVKGMTIHEALSAHNWIYFNDDETFDSAYESFVHALETDLDYVRAHTRLTVRAREWEAKGRDASFLLQGVDLREAERWINAAVGKSPQPTQLQTEYILASRQVAGSRQRIVIAAVSVAMVLTTILAIFAATQYRAAEISLAQANEARATAVAESQRADLQARIALSKQLAAQSLTLQGERLDLALLLSLESKHIDDQSGANAKAQAEGSLISGLETSPQLRTFLRGHEDWVEMVAFTPDETTMISADFSGDIIIWDTAANQPIRHIGSTDNGEMNDAVLSPDGTLLATTSNNDIVLWDVASGEERGRLTGHESEIWDLDFSPDGKTLASASVDMTIRLWDVASQQVNGQPLTGHESPVSGVKFSPDGTLLASAGYDDRIIFWNLATGQPDGEPLRGHNADIESLDFSPDGRKLASGSADGEIILWNVQTRQMITDPLIGHEDVISALAFSPDGRLLASGSGDRTIRIWSATTGRSIGERLVGHSNWVNALAFNQDNRTLISGGDDKNIIIWDPNRRQRIASTLVLQRHDVNTLAMSPGTTGDNNSYILAAGHPDGSITMWDAATGKAFGTTLIGHKQAVWGVAFSPDFSMIVSAGNDGQVILWRDLTAYRPVGQVLIDLGENFQFHAVTFSPDGKLVAASGRSSDADSNAKIYLWDTTTFETVGEIVADSPAVNTLAFSPDSELLASGDASGAIQLWHTTTLERSGDPLIAHDGDVLSLAFNADGSKLASGGADEIIILWDMALRQPSGQPLTGHTWYVASLAFSPDGKVLASGGGDRSLRLWDVATGDAIGGSLDAHVSAIRGVIFTPDGQQLFTAGDDNRIIVWDVSFDSWRQQACAIANRNLTELEWQRFVGEAGYQETCSELGGSSS